MKIQISRPITYRQIKITKLGLLRFGTNDIVDQIILCAGGGGPILYLAGCFTISLTVARSMPVAALQL